MHFYRDGNEPKRRCPKSLSQRVRHIVGSFLTLANSFLSLVRTGISSFYCMVCRQELTQQAWDCYSLKILLTRLALGGCLATSISGEFCQFPHKNDSLCRNCLYSTNNMVNACFPSRSLEFGYMLGRRYPVKTMGTNSLTSSSGWQHFAWVVTTHSREDQGVLCDSAGRGLSGSLPLVSSSPHPQYLFAQLTLLCVPALLTQL